eukprot:3068769-Rhodomonas_salina.1
MAPCVSASSSESPRHTPHQDRTRRIRVAQYASSVLHAAYHVRSTPTSPYTSLVPLTACEARSTLRHIA